MLPACSNAWLYFESEPLACCETCRRVLYGLVVRMRHGPPACAAALPSNGLSPCLPRASVRRPRIAGFALSRAWIKAGAAEDTPCVQVRFIAVRARPGSPSGELSSPRTIHLRCALPDRARRAPCLPMPPPLTSICGHMCAGEGVGLVGLHGQAAGAAAGRLGCGLKAGSGLFCRRTHAIWTILRTAGLDRSFKGITRVPGGIACMHMLCQTQGYM